MGKIAPDAMIDASLDYVAGSNYCCICSGSPSTFEEAFNTLMLARVSVSSENFTKADDISGRKLTMATITNVTLTNSGSALAVALVKDSDSTLRYVTTCTEQYLIAGGLVDIPSWKINIQDPI